MSNYFDYVLESAETQIDTYDDVHFLYNEMDASMAQFDSYVQEGVGVKILIGIGIAAALGGLIALIIKLFSGKSGGSSASTKAKTAKAATTKAKKAGVKTVKVKVATGEETAPKQATSAAQSVDKAEKHVEEIVETVNQYNGFVEKYFDILAREIEKLMDKYPMEKLENLSEREEAQLKSRVMDLGMKLFDEAIDDFPIIKKLFGTKTKLGVKRKINKVMMGDESTAEEIAKNALKYVVSELDIDEVAKFVDSTMKQCKTLLFDGKKLTKNGERLKQMILKSEGGKANEILKGFTSEQFDELTAMVSGVINEAYEFISQNMTEIVKACKDALAVLEKGGSLDEAFGGGSFENIGNKVNDRYGEDIENMKDAANGMMGGRFRYA